MKIDNQKEIGAWLKARRKTKAVSSYQMERKYGVFPHSMKAIETGNNDYNISTLIKYCKAVDVDILLKERE